jgi:hypothetical protein
MMEAICVKQPRLLNLEGKREAIMQVRVFRKNSAFFGRKIGDSATPLNTEQKETSIREMPDYP